jgi:uncharacterized protein YidB (DUF937 family)
MSILDTIKQQAESVLGPSVSAAIDHKATELMKFVHDPAHGGLGGLVKRFQDEGLGPTITSWIGTGANASITPQQIASALGPRLQALAEKLGVPVDQVAQKLSAALPVLIDKMTPDGKMPSA